VPKAVFVIMLVIAGVIVLGAGKVERAE